MYTQKSENLFGMVRRWRRLQRTSCYIVPLSTFQYLIVFSISENKIFLFLILCFQFHFYLFLGWMNETPSRSFFRLPHTSLILTILLLLSLPPSPFPFSLILLKVSGRKDGRGSVRLFKVKVFVVKFTI